LQETEKAINKAKRKQAARLKRAKLQQTMRIGVKKTIRKLRRRIA